MKYFIVPQDVTISTLGKDGRPIANDGEPIVYSFATFHHEHVWTSEAWRTGSGDASDHFEECYEKIATAKPGTVIELSDPAFETYQPIATMRGTRLNPHVAVEFNRLMRPILRATAKRPEAPKAATPPEADAPSN